MTALIVGFILTGVAMWSYNQYAKRKSLEEALKKEEEVDIELETDKVLQRVNEKLKTKEETND